MICCAMGEHNNGITESDDNLGVCLWPTPACCRLCGHYRHCFICVADHVGLQGFVSPWQGI